MLFSSEKYAKYICLIVIILMYLGLLTASTIQCIQCGEDEKCSTTINETAKDCPSNNYTKCFTQIDADGNIQRGCKTDKEAKTCTTENNCIVTDDEKNNQLICKKCDGTYENCSQTDMMVNDPKYIQICDAGIRNCIKKVDNKLVVRGCATEAEVSHCTDISTCATCDTVNCNTGIFPTKRIRCYQCSDSKCGDVTANGLAAKPCAIYEAEDKCYTIGKSETEMIRGCQSDTKDNQCGNNAEGCLLCNLDNCNNRKYKYDQELKCHQCSSDDASNVCFKDQTDQEPKYCEKQILYNAGEYCYIQIKNDKIQRGCIHDNADISVYKCNDYNSDTCIKCNYRNGCNSKAVK